MGGSLFIMAYETIHDNPRIFKIKYVTEISSTDFVKSTLRICGIN